MVIVTTSLSVNSAVPNGESIETNDKSNDIIEGYAFIVRTSVPLGSNQSLALETDCPPPVSYTHLTLPTKA